VATLPTPCARDGKGPGLLYGLPDLLEEGGTRHGLLPTPTAAAYGSNRSMSAGATRRCSLDQLGGPLLPTPTVADSRSSANATAGRTTATGHAGRTRTDATRLLPTRRASNAGTPGRRAGAGFRPPLSQVLLPTPRATDGEKGCPGQRGSHGDITLPAAAVRVPDRMLPTPRASGGHGRCHHGEGGLDLTTTAADVPHAPEPADDRWGAYAAAVTRWEHLLGRPVPQPTQPGRHGKPVLAPPFVEWLMGLPEGWVTDPPFGLPRTRALRVLGNGVVSRQAAAALRLLLCPRRWPVPR
jgi:DNA (cytosine-5)-methyltransferase 1